MTPSMKTRYVRMLLPALALAALPVALSGCKAQQQLQQQMTDLEGKVTDSQKRVTALDGDLKKANYEITQLKQLVAKLGTVTVDLQKAEEERQKAVAEAKAKAEATAKAAPKGKSKKKKH